MTRSTRTRTAHFPRAMAPRATGARTSAVAARHLSISLPLDPAASPGAGREGFYGPQELLRRKVRPQCVGHVELGVGYLPEQEVGDAQLAARSDHEVHLGYLRGIEVAGEGRFVYLPRREAVGDDAPCGVHYLRAAAVVEGDVDVELVVMRGEVLCLLDGVQDGGREVLAASEEA